MRHQLIVLPTGEAVRTNRAVFEALPAAGVPLMVLTQFILDCLAVGEPEPLDRSSLLEGWAEYAQASIHIDERIIQILTSDAFCDAFYALYMAMHRLQEMMLTPNVPGFITTLHHHDWQGQDLVVSRDILQPGWHGGNIQ